MSDAFLCKSLDRLLVGIRRNGGKRDILNALCEGKCRLSLRVLPCGARMIGEIDEASAASRFRGDSQFSDEAPHGVGNIRGFLATRPVLGVEKIVAPICYFPKGGIMLLGSLFRTFALPAVKRSCAWDKSRFGCVEIDQPSRTVAAASR